MSAEETKVENEVETVEEEKATSKKPKKEKRPQVTYPDKPSCILDVTKQYIMDFINDDIERGEWLINLSKTEKKYDLTFTKKGDFQKFRTDFIDKFFPELKAKKMKSVKNEWEKFLEDQKVKVEANKKK